MKENSIHVVAAIIEKDKRFLIAQRKAGSHMASKWEFPGGKVERGESPEQSLMRELFEEFGIRAEIGDFIGESTFDYGNVSIWLSAYRVTSFLGDFKLNDHEQIAWVKLQELPSYDLADADIPIARKLTEDIYLNHPKKPQ